MRQFGFGVLVLDKLLVAFQHDHLGLAVGGHVLARLGIIGGVNAGRNVTG